VQPGAKINSVYYCHNVLEQGLLPDIRRSSNDKFLFQHNGALAHCSRHTVAYLCSHVPEFIEPENWPPNSPDLNPVYYSVWGHCNRWCIVTKFRIDQPAETRANRLLGSTKPGHVKSSDWSAAKKIDDGYQGQGCPCWISSGLTMCVNDRCYVIVCWVKIH